MALIKTQTGMTLLEVLVAMTLMVIISAISYASLNGLIDAKIHTDKVALNMRKELLTSQQLTKDIHAIINRSIKGQRGENQAAVIGRYSFLAFSRNGNSNPLNQTRSDLQRVQWLLRKNKLIRRSLNYLDTGSFPKWIERDYLEKIKEFSLVFNNRSGQESRRWPIANNPTPLNSISVKIVKEDGTKLNYFLVIRDDT